MRISLRSLLLLLVIIALPLAGIYNRYNGKRRLATFLATVEEASPTELTTIGDRPIGHVRWSYQLDGWYDYVKRSPEYHGPEWIRRLFGDDALAYIKRASVSLDSKTHSATMSKLLGNGDSLRGLEELQIHVKDDIGFDCRCLSGLNDVRLLQLSGISLEEADFRSISKMEDLEILFVSGCQFKSESVGPLAESKHLAWVQVSHSIGVSEEVQQIRKHLPAAYISYDSRDR